MELSQIINTKTDPVNSSIAKMAYDESTLFTDKQSTGNSFVDVDGKSAVALYVTGAFVAGIRVHGSLVTNDNTAFPDEHIHRMKAYSFFDETYVEEIKKAGVYLVENIGYTRLRVRVCAYTSGSVSVVARVFAEPVHIKQAQEKKQKRIVRVAEFLGVEVDANTDKKLIDNSLDTSDYVYFFAVTRSDTAHSREVYFLFYFTGATLGSTYGAVTAINDSEIRQKSERIEPLSESMNVGLKNNDTQAHTYDVFVYGVR